jgi:hypothetical protein
MNIPNNQRLKVEYRKDESIQVDGREPAQYKLITPEAEDYLCTPIQQLTDYQRPS